MCPELSHSWLHDPVRQTKAGVASDRRIPQSVILQLHSAATFINFCCGIKAHVDRQTEMNHECQTLNPAGGSWKTPVSQHHRTVWLWIFLFSSQIYTIQLTEKYILLLATSKNLFLDSRFLVVQSLMSSYERQAWTQYVQQQWKYFLSDPIQSAGNPKSDAELKPKPIGFFCYASLKIHRWGQSQQLSD